MNYPKADYTYCKTCPVGETEEKQLKCPNNLNHLMPIKLRVNGDLQAPPEVKVIYDHCKSHWDNDHELCTFIYDDLFKDSDTTGGSDSYTVRT